MVLFARNRRYYLIPLEDKKDKCGKIFDKRKNLIGKIKTSGKDIIITEINGVVSLRLKKMGLSSKYLIEDHFGNHLGQVGVSKINGKQVFVEDGDGNKILFTQGFVEWSFIIRGKRNKKIAVGTTLAMMLSKNTHGILHAKPSFILSMRPHHPDSRFLLAIFVILLKKMSRIDISKYYLKLGPALPL